MLFRAIDHGLGRGNGRHDGEGMTARGYEKVAVFVGRKPVADRASHGFDLVRTTGSIADAAPNGANQRQTTVHCTNATAACTTIEGVPEGPLR